jgi:hypothetical protein
MRAGHHCAERLDGFQFNPYVGKTDREDAIPPRAGRSVPVIVAP